MGEAAAIMVRPDMQANVVEHLLEATAASGLEARRLALLHRRTLHITGCELDKANINAAIHWTYLTAARDIVV